MMRSRSELATILSDGVFEQVLDAAFDVVIITDDLIDAPGPQILYVNEAFERVTGYSSDEVIGRSPRLLQGPETDRRTLRRLSHALRTKSPFRGELVNYDKLGQRYWVDLSIFPVVSPTATNTFFVAIQRNVTDAREQDLEREDDRRRMTDLMEQAPDAMVVTDLQGEILMVNRVAEFMFGYDRTHLVGRSIEILVPDGLREKHRQRRAEFSNRPSRRPMSSELTITGRRSDGTVFDCEISLGPIEGPDATAIAATVRDVSENRRIIRALNDRESELRATMAELMDARDRAVQADRAKSDFLAQISHELRTPLNAIMGYSELMSMTAGVTTQEQIRHYAADIHRAGQTLLAHIDDLLYVSSGEHELARLQIGEVCLRRVMAQALWAHHRPIRRKGLSVRSNGSLRRVHVLGDATALQLIINNLLDNAVQHAPAGSILTMDFWAEEATVSMALRDRGPGMAPSDLQRVIHPFLRTRNPMVATEAGIGLGLPIANDLITRMKGSLALENHPLGGLRVVLTLPRASDAASMATRP